MARQKQDVAQRLDSYTRISVERGIVVDGQYVPCWEWVGYINRDGYGVAKVDGKPKLVHRVTVELRDGSLDPDLVVDHLCSNRKCRCPYHLEPVPQRVNVERGQSPVGKRMRAAAAKEAK